MIAIQSYPWKEKLRTSRRILYWIWKGFAQFPPTGTGTLPDGNVDVGSRNMGFLRVQIFDEISICLKTFLFQKIDNHFLNAWDEYSQSKFLHIVEKNHIPLKLKKLWDFLICFWKLEEIFTIKKGYFTGKMLFCHEWGIASLPRFPHFFMFDMMQNQWRVSPQSLP